MNRSIPKSVVASTVAILLGLMLVLLGSSQVGAQGPTPTGSPPPTYDYDADRPGTQPPTSTLPGGLLENYEARSLRTHRFGVQVRVPLAEAQALLPPGYVATASPSGSSTAVVNLLCEYQLRVEQSGVGSFGPASGLLVALPAVQNTNLGRSEGLILATFLNDQSTVEAYNSNFGPGVTRLAKTEIEIEEKGGKLRFTCNVEQEGLGFRLRLGAEGPAALVNRAKADPAAGFSRFLNGLTLGPAFRQATQADNVVVPAGSANVTVEAKDGKLHLPGGNLTLGLVTGSVNILRNLEVFTKLEPAVAGALSATVQQVGTTATVRIALRNTTSDTLTLADVRSPIPAGMGLLSSTPAAQLVGNELRWTHVSDIAPGQTRTFSYRLDTRGQAGSVQAWAALIGSQTNTSALSNVAAIAAP